MKKNKIAYKFFVALTLAFAIVGCSDDNNGGSGVSFNSIATTVEEDSGIVTLTLRDGSVSADEIILGGSATEGEDYTVGVTDEGIQITLINDVNYEAVETIRVQIPSSGNGIHTISVLCDGDDNVGWDVADFVGVWHATEDYGSSTFGPYNVTFTQDAGNPNRFNFPNFYGSGATYTAYVVFDVANGTVSFPDQTVGAPANDRGPLTASTGTFDLCEETLTINLTYDGGPWVYRFSRN